MTNLQQASQRVPAAVLQRIWLFAPVAAGGAAAVVLTLVGLVPMWINLDKDRQRLAELESLQSQVAMLRRELSTLDERRDKARHQRDTLIALITGTSDQATFLALLDREALASGVQLRLYEPQAVAATPPPGQPGQPQPPAQAAPPGQAQGAPPPDPLALQGLDKRRLLMQARGPYPNLVTFLRRIEKLDVLVGQSDLNLEVEPLPSDAIKAGTAKLPAPQVTLKLALTLFSKSAAPPGAPAAAGSPAAPAAGGQPAAAGAPTPAPANGAAPNAAQPPAAPAR